MKITDFLTESRIIFDLKSTNKKDAIEEIAQYFLKEDGIIKDGQFDIFMEDLMERENLTSTGMQDGIAIPHAKSPAVSKIALILAIVSDGIDFDSFDGEDSNFIFMIAAPEDIKKEHLELLQKISKLSYEDDLLEKLLVTKDRFEVIKLLSLV